MILDTFYYNLSLVDLEKNVFHFHVFLDNNCSWCHQTILSAKSNEVMGTSGNVFCSENCFLLWRRASFKRAKTCDFCKNIRNAVSYVDFNDGTTQLQFCSEKCLNQYKMKIFCRETQAQLELNPHLKESNNDSGGKLFFIFKIRAQELT